MVLSVGILEPRWAASKASAAADKAFVSPLSKEEEERGFEPEPADAVIVLEKVLLAPREDDVDPLNPPEETGPRVPEEEEVVPLIPVAEVGPLTPSLAAVEPLKAEASERDSSDTVKATADPPRLDEEKDPLPPKAEDEDPWLCDEWAWSSVDEAEDAPEKPGTV